MTVTEDRMFAGSLVLRQPRHGHRAGTDAVLLAAACPDDMACIADFGAGTGVVGLRVASQMPQARVTLFEREPDLVALAEENVRANGLTERVRVVACDVTRLGANPAFRETFSCILSNPPFHAPERRRASPDQARARAHMIDPESGGVAGWMRALAGVLEPGGQVVMIHAADQIEAVLAAAQGRFGAIRLRLVHPAADQPAIRLLFAARKGSRAPMTILPPLMLHDGQGQFLPEIAALHRGEGRIVL